MRLFISDIVSCIEIVFATFLLIVHVFVSQIKEMNTHFSFLFSLNEITDLLNHMH